MKTISKLAAVGLALTSGSAFAALDLPSTGNSGVALFVQDQSNLARTAVFDTGLHLDDFILQSTVTNGSNPATAGTVAATLTYATTSTNSTDLATFMSTVSQAGYKFALIAYDNVGAGNTTDPFRYLATSATQYSTAIKSTMKNSDLNSSNLGGSMNLGFADINNSLGASIFASPTDFGQAGFDAGGMDSAYGKPSASPLVSVGSAANLYVWATGSSTSSATARLYQLQSVTLTSDGTISGLASTAAVPLPAGVWLLGSALAGLGSAVRRRRRVAA